MLVIHSISNAIRYGNKANESRAAMRRYKNQQVSNNLWMSGLLSLYPEVILVVAAASFAQGLHILSCMKNNISHLFNTLPERSPVLYTGHYTALLRYRLLVNLLQFRSASYRYINCIAPEFTQFAQRCLHTLLLLLNSSQIGHCVGNVINTLI